MNELCRFFIDASVASMILCGRVLVLAALRNVILILDVLEHPGTL